MSRDTSRDSAHEEVSGREADGPDEPRRRVVLGRIGGPHGVRGALRVQHFTEARDTLLGYPRWMLGKGEDWTEYRLTGGHAHGDGLRVTLDGIADRDAAEELRGLEVSIWRDCLPRLEAGEFYWSDLLGLTVTTTEGVDLGVVERMMETGANDVLVVKGERERLIPFLMDDVIRRVDLDAGHMEVDWDPGF